MELTKDYAERVYAGVLGKMIGVYAGRPFEGWTYSEIMERLGEINYYVNDKVGEFNKKVLDLNYSPPLIVTDDDIAGTFTFLRALPDYHNDRNITPEKIGRTWLNYIIENRNVFWWGGMGNSTEHTAYLRLKQGLKSPESGSAKRNGLIVSEQIGSQIFIDGWAMVAPGDPGFASDLARRAASVSHDGEAIYGAQVIAAMEAASFVEGDMNALLDIGVSYIPKDSKIYSVVSDVREWHSSQKDWHKTFAKIREKYGYDKFGGNVHIVPNHAVVILGLLYGNNDFQTSMKVVNTAGWDTDCNAGNVGCLMGIKNGLAGLESGPPWRSPVADRILMSTADGGRAITDAVIETMHIVNIGRSLAGEEPLAPKKGARFHFEFPGSVQGFSPEETTTTIQNIAGYSKCGTRSLEIRFSGCGSISTPTFILPGELGMTGYQLQASPTLYPGQTVSSLVQSPCAMEARLFIKVYNAEGKTDVLYGPNSALRPGEIIELLFTVPRTDGNPIAQVGIEAQADGSAVIYLDYLSWKGTPDISFKCPEATNVLSVNNRNIWRRAWVQGVDQWDCHWKAAYRLVQNRGRGLLIQGTREWEDYEAEATIRITMAESAGIAVRVQGMERYYALLCVHGDLLRLVKVLDGETVLAEIPFVWEYEKPYCLRLKVQGCRIDAWVDNTLVFLVEDTKEPLKCGAVAFVIEEGHLSSDSFSVRP